MMSSAGYTSFYTEYNYRPMARIYTCDLHIHTCLSPCAELDMHPSAIVRAALDKNLDVIAICDHCASENAGYVMKAAAGTPLLVVPGMEATSREEVHVVALFGDIEALGLLQELIYASLKGENNEDVFGVQAIVNEAGEVEGFNPHLLIGASDIPLGDLVDRIHGLGGIAIASHIDRESFGILGQLGFLPPDAPFDALEVSAGTGIKKARAMYPDLDSYTMITSSDAHFIPDIGKAPARMLLEDRSFSEIGLALKNAGGRRVLEE